MNEWMKRSGNNYMHHDMQNEMLKVMALKVLREIAAEIQSAECYAIMVDETSDVSNKEQLVFCVRWVDCNLVAREEFIGLHSLDVTDAKTIAGVIKDILIRMNVSLSRCRGQCYDGCSTMKGEKKGVAKRIKDIEKKALFTHCYTHSLNLAVGDAIKFSNIIKEALDTTHEITKLIKKSPKRDAKLESLKTEMEVADETDQSPVETVTRWTVRAKSLGSIISNFTFLKDLWEWALDNCSDTDMKARIRGVNSYMKTFDFVYGVFLGELILGHSDNLSKTLQNPALSAVQGQDCAMKTVEVLEKLRNDDSYDMFWINANAKAEDLEVGAPNLPRKKGPPKKLTDFHGYGPAQPVHHSEPKDMYRKHYFEALDLTINCIKDRFDQEDYRHYANLQELLLKAARNEQFDSELSDVIAFYDGDFDESLLRTQLKVFGASIPTITDMNFSDTQGGGSGKNPRKVW